VSEKTVYSQFNGNGDDFLHLAAHFRHVQDTLPDMFNMMAKAEGISARKAYYLATIDRTFSKLGVPRERLLTIGWTKLQMMCEHVNQGNCEEFLAAAESTTVREFSLWLRGAQPIDGARSILMYFTPDQYNIFKKTILKHGGMECGKGLVGKEEALIKALSKGPE